MNNLILALLHQPLIYYNLEATQKESLNLSSLLHQRMKN